ncbi:hypothetical protein [Anaerotignum propionicum]|uniref:Uncharacterized protein n=1 Tax=Anaerotignum propionicum DSM 1682 TaxID=991789 RepID=A0AA94I080_ANAPI|nr:hypothetical protein [Anaerotignum propionicum]SHE99720.1 hypothetical protein SAMN02745151_02442 [[Clostridium] propionicum DSM 1682] [Anaerotignum propionicum DSM 1682]
MEQYLDVAKAVFEAYTNITYDETNVKHFAMIQEMAKCHKTKEGNEGLNSISISGTTENYNEFYPYYIRVMLDSVAKPRSKVRFL